MAEEKQHSEAKSDIYEKNMRNVVLIDRNHTISYYIDLCATILRQKQELTVAGAGNNCDIAVSVVTGLKTRKLGELTSIRTGMDISANVLSGSDNKWSQPSAMMTFHFCPGENAAYISGHRQRKMMEIFEKHDTDVAGCLSIDQIKSFKLSDVFKATKTQKQNANEFIMQFTKQKQEKMNLPDFIKYASLLIHPLLKSQVFNDALVNIK